jgi:hypothetical protein
LIGAELVLGVNMRVVGMDVSYVLAIEHEVFEFKMMRYFSVLIHIFAGTYITLN